MIEINHVTFQHEHADEPSLRDVSLTIPDGQCVLLCGESGSGKTTVTRLINGLIPHYYEGELSGSVTVEGKDVSQTELYELAPLVGSVFQNPRSQFFCVDTTSELAFGCENIGLPEEEILSRMSTIAQEIRAEHLLDRNIFELSGGEKQKIAYGSVAALQPTVMVLDEPTSNLDVRAIDDLRRIIELWKSQGKTVIIAEHRLYWLTDVCDRVVCMRNGSVTCDTSMAHFKELPDQTIKEMGLRSLFMHMELELNKCERTATKPSGSLILKDFKFTYHDTVALDIDELTIPKGSIVAVIGSNGAGKSTFSRCLCGLEKQFRGTVEEDGFLRNYKQQLKECYLVMQDVNHQLFCESVKDEVQLGMKDGDPEEAEALAAEVLAQLDLTALKDRHPMSLSGGQKQRVAVASSILANKSMLVFDEPTSGLDYRHMKQAAELFCQFSGRKTVFIVTHDPELILRSATHVLHLEAGSVKDFYPMDAAGMVNLRNFFIGSPNLRNEVPMKKEKVKEKSPVQRVLELAGAKRRNYIAAVVLATLGAVCQILPYVVMAFMIQKLMAGNTDLVGYGIDCLIMAGLWLVRVLFHALSTTFSHLATFEVLGNIRKRAMMKIERMALGDIQNRGSGELKNILCERIDSIETTLAHVTPEFTGNLLATLGTAVFIFIIDWRMGLASLLTLPIGLVFFMTMMMGYEKSYARCVNATKNLNDAAVEYIGGIEVIKVFGKAKSSYEKFVAAAKEGAQSYIDWMRKNNFSFTAALNVMPATLISVLPIGGWLVMNETLAVSDFILVVILSMSLITPIITCMTYSDDLAKLGTILGEVTGILDAAEMPRPDESKAEPADNTVVLKDVHFGYDEREVLHGINVTFAEGTVNALVGPSGGGKSTIAKLIASFWDVQDGCITLGGVDIRDMSMLDYNERVAYVSQDNFLFDDTIRENIRMGNLQATDEEVEEVARQCGCYDFIMGLEDGFDTVVGSSGNHLSGGEKQRISIARAMLKNAPLVILDEATAYTDPENEALIQMSVARLIQGKTLIVIAHRLSTITDADQIVVVHDGFLEAQGTHDELLSTCGLYKDLWEAHISVKDGLEGGEEHV